MTKRRLTGHGWAPYWFPMVAFLGLVELGSRLSDGGGLGLLALKIAVPGGFVAWYALRGDYPELRGLRPSPAVVGDVLVGLLGAVLWVAPFLLFDDLRPESDGFDAQAYGAAGAGLALALRAVGYALVTPFVEELFVRSWLLRFLDVFDTRKDFRKVPIARFRWRSFVLTTLYFVFTHQSWEWGVMAAWTLLTMAWFYHRRHLMGLVVAHAVTNGAIFAFVLTCDGRFTDAAGAPISLWFFI